MEKSRRICVGGSQLRKCIKRKANIKVYCMAFPDDITMLEVVLETRKDQFKSSQSITSKTGAAISYPTRKYEYIYYSRIPFKKSDN